MHRLATCLWIALGLSTIVAAADRGAQGGFGGDLRTDYTDNFYRLTDEQIADFNQEQAGGERFFNMDDAEDLVTRVRLRGDLDWRLDKKRKLRLSLRGSYIFHLNNDIADYPRLESWVRWDVTKADELYGRIEAVFDRFRKNYREPSTTVFVPAVHDELDATIGYSRKVSKRLRVGGELLHLDRKFDEPLASRDRTGDYLRVFTTYGKAKAVKGETSLEVGRVDFDPVLDFGVVVDRSYDQLRIDQEFRFKLRAKSWLQALVQYRFRSAKTNNPLDEARFDREDTRWRAELSVGKKLRKGLLLEGRVRFTDNDSERLDPTIEADEIGYQEARVGVGLRYVLR